VTRRVAGGCAPNAGRKGRVLHRTSRPRAVASGGNRDRAASVPVSGVTQRPVDAIGRRRYVNHGPAEAGHYVRQEHKHAEHCRRPEGLRLPFRLARPAHIAATGCCARRKP
jgi:hypothetical protein